MCQQPLCVSQESTSNGTNNTQPWKDSWKTAAHHPYSPPPARVTQISYRWCNSGASDTKSLKNSHKLSFHGANSNRETAHSREARSISRQWDVKKLTINLSLFSFFFFNFILKTGNRIASEFVKKGLEVKTKLHLEIKFPLEFEFNPLSEVSFAVVCNSK